MTRWRSRRSTPVPDCGTHITGYSVDLPPVRPPNPTFRFNEVRLAPCGHHSTEVTGTITMRLLSDLDLLR